MAEYRPYRNVNSAARAGLMRVKLIAVSSFLLLAVLINWIVTQHVARLFGYAPGLGPSLIGSIYAPWEWLIWWTRWHWAERLQPLWELCLRQAAYPLFAAGALAAGSVIIARHLIADDTPDLHGSAQYPQHNKRKRTTSSAYGMPSSFATSSSKNRCSPTRPSAHVPGRLIAESDGRRFAGNPPEAKIASARHRHS